MLNLTRLCQIVQATWFTLESVWRDRREGPSTRGPLNYSIMVTHTCRKVDTWDRESSRSRQLTNTAFLLVGSCCTWLLSNCCGSHAFMSIVGVRRILSGGPLASGLILVMNLKKTLFPFFNLCLEDKVFRYCMQRLQGSWRRLSFNHQRRIACRQHSNWLLHSVIHSSPVQPPFPFGGRKRGKIAACSSQFDCCCCGGNAGTNPVKVWKRSLFKTTMTE